MIINQGPKIILWFFEAPQWIAQYPLRLRYRHPAPSQSLTSFSFHLPQYQSQSPCRSVQSDALQYHRILQTNQSKSFLTIYSASGPRPPSCN